MHGKKKIDNYTIHLNKLLGEGSYGKVYQGEQEGTGLRVAVKMLDKKIIQRDDYIKKALLQEIKILGALKSPNIVSFMDVMQSANYYYIVQELCTGGDLRKLMKEKGVIPEAEAIEMLKQICNGFVVMLKQGVIHRDLKPENILINDGILKICDFGFSKRLDNKRVRAVTAVGTPLYMTLQILKSQPYTGKCDIWALGFIFYEMLHGVTPWTAQTQYELVKNLEQIPLKINPKFSQNVKSVLQSMLKIQQKDRIGWDDLLRHPIFQGFFNYYVTMHESFKNKMKMIMSQLRYVINSSNIDLERLFASRGYSKKSELTLQDFRNFLSVVGMDIQPEEVRYVFENIDANDSNTISLAELEKVLLSHQISMKSMVQHDFSKKLSVDSQGHENKSTLEDELKQRNQRKLLAAFRKLDQKMTKNNLLLHQVYDAYDINKDGEMTVKQFGRILTKLDHSFTDQEIKMSFNNVDISQNGKVSFNEFNAYFCKCVGVALKALGNKGW